MSEQASWADAREVLREILGVEGPALEGNGNDALRRALAAELRERMSK